MTVSKTRWGLFLAVTITINQFGIGTGIGEATAAKQKMPEGFSSLYFDFGLKSELADGCVAVEKNTIYSSSSGYGLVGHSAEAFVRGRLDFADKLSKDGLKAKGELKFRVDLPNGNYWIELILDGGSLTTWSGEIFANQTILAEKLSQYTVSEEGESPPPFWIMVRKVSVVDGKLVLSVKADKQASTVSGLRIFPEESWPLRYSGGKLSAARKLKAPNAPLIIKLLNSNAVEEAQRLIDAIPEELAGFEKAYFLLALAGNIYTQNPKNAIELARHLLLKYGKNQVENSLALFLVNRYLEADTYYKMAGWDWATQYSGAGIFDRMVYAGQIHDELIQVNEFPLHHRSLWELGKLTFMAWVEEHGDPQLERAKACFSELKNIYPDHRLLAIYNGEKKVTDDQLPPVVDPGAPDWVNETNRAITMLQELIHYWVNTRQAENGEFGGKYDDDVEMLRSWPIVRLALGDSTTLLGLQRIVDGIWNSGWIVNGFSAVVRDVEHASEPVADTQPMMIGLDYGNPIYVERSMESAKGLFDVWTGVNSYGHRHFKSSWYSATEVDTTPPKDSDLQMNARTVKVARWLAWYNRHPLAMKFLTEWADAWLEDCLRTDKGKPYGIVPAAVRYSDDAIGGPADNWHHPGMFWRYYDFSGGTMMMQQFLATYQLTQDRKYLQPIELAIELVKRYQDQDTRDAEEGSEAWVAEILKKSSSFTEVVEQWRLMTGDNRYDDLVEKIGSQYIKFYLSGDTDYLYSGSRKISQGLAYNKELITTEAYYTDRIYMGNLHTGELVAASHLESMYTGGALSKGFHPFYSVTWEGFGKNFVAAVKKSTPTEIELLAYNLSQEPKTGRLLCWTLGPGQYEVVQKSQTENQQDSDINVDKVKIAGRNAEIPLTLPSRKMQNIRLRRVESINTTDSTDKADLAITFKELRVEEKESGDVEISIPVHNIGIQSASRIVVNLVHSVTGTEKIMAKKTIPHLDAPLDFNPRIVSIGFKMSSSESSKGRFAIIVDPENKIPEITEKNNRVNFLR